MRKPNAGNFQRDLMQQQIQQQTALKAQEAAYSAQREAARASYANQVAVEAAQLEADKKKKIGQSVNLGTLLTSPQGILGNPALSAAKLGG